MTKTNPVVILIRGGNLESVWAHEPLDVTLFDADNAAYGDDPDGTFDADLLAATAGMADWLVDQSDGPDRVPESAGVNPAAVPDALWRADNMTTKKYGEPWRMAGGMVDGYVIVDNIGATIMPLTTLEANRQRRMVACVNGCAGLNPAAVPELEQKCGRLVTAIERYRADKGEPAESSRFLDVEFATREARAALAKARQS